MNPKTVKKALKDAIPAMTDRKWLFSARPGKDNTRNRKFPFQKVIPFILTFRGGTLNHEIMDFLLLTVLTYGLLPIPMTRIPTIRGVNGQRAYNLLHINAMYDLHQHIYVDALVQKSRKPDESAALTAMVDRSAIESALLLAGRGYESYNNLAHIQEKGWKFLIRIKDGTAGIASGLALPAIDEFDVPFHLKLTNKQSNEVKELLKGKNHYNIKRTECCFIVKLHLSNLVLYVLAT